MPNQTISLCMIARNEEKYLEQCLNSVKDVADEIIIVDTGSTDRTKEIARKFGAKIFDFKWADDFSAARNESLKHSSKDWVLVLDADEVIEKEDLEKIKIEINKCEGNIAGFSFEQRSYIGNFFEGAVKNNSDFEPVKKYPFFISHFLVRLFRNRLGLHFRHRVHELVEDSINEKGLKYKKMDVALHHFGSVKGGLANEKAEQYSKLILKQLEDDPESPRYNYQAARMCLGKNDFSGALKYFEKTAKLDQSYKLVFSEIAKIYLQMNDKNRAIEYFKKSMKQNPGNPSPANNLAVVYISVGKFEEAKKILEEQLKKHSDNRALNYNYREVLRSLNV